MKNIGQLINEFDNLPTSTVADFNKTFPHSKLKHCGILDVEIGEPIRCGSVQTREIFVGGELYEHVFHLHEPTTSELLYLKEQKEEQENGHRFLYTEDKGFN
jgi:hypothetical protein